MKKFDRVRVRGTEETGMILGIEAKRVHSANKIVFVTVELECGNIMVYDISELKLL